MDRKQVTLGELTSSRVEDSGLRMVESEVDGATTMTKEQESEMGYGQHDDMVEENKREGQMRRRLYTFSANPPPFFNRVVLMMRVMYYPITIMCTR